MIAYLHGSVLSKQDKSLILKCGQVGYLVFANASLLSKISPQDEIELFIYNHIREDCLDLYGFPLQMEMDFFKQLISINGIGPKAALEILNFDMEKTKLAILNDDVDFITKIPGIGKKTAQRMIIDLKNKVELKDLNTGEYTSATSPAIEDEVMQALIGLGYQRKHVKMRLQEVPAELLEAEEIITYLLKHS